MDAITRSCLWNEGLDFGHGTGHGVGAFLNVHEGPQRISPFSSDVALQAGMVLSNEPGYYESGWGGIRLENLYVVKKSRGISEHPAGKGWLCFETLTLIPFDRRLIDKRYSFTQMKLNGWMNIIKSFERNISIIGKS